MSDKNLVQLSNTSLCCVEAGEHISWQIPVMMGNGMIEYRSCTKCKKQERLVLFCEKEELCLDCCNCISEDDEKEFDEN